MDKIRINYCGMPVYFGLKDLSIVEEMRFDHPKEPIIKETPRKKSKANRIAKPPPLNKGKALSKRPANKCKENIDGLFEIKGRIYKAMDLIEDIKDKTIPKRYREQLCLV
ncbi:hypothetical protein FXO38_29592 [Capsicum annuum]|nr:hypothetical protein FXO38_29592 [Capsicum annuum]KAF3647360.1 hypothetical protein FXO37_20014 [Capsicum annuum]